ncbi:Bax inhibitor-1/YccA family membrane protein [Streptomyces violaceorubidus]|uniref:Bax inhibitor-1/YccA family membrane protein n=1 Tax=Streptomyces violaceorubidus TaxID=284042 RepID=UPI0004C133A7|nr:Bax inhibitor-1/YccA family protein [Streptomyces violaceorubidus]
MALVEQQTLKSSNPILSRPQFTRRGGQKTAVRDPRTGLAVVLDRIGAGTEREQDDAARPVPPLYVGDLLTMDTVLPRAATALGTTALVAVLSWTVLPPARIGTAWSWGIVAAAAVLTAVLVITQYRRNKPSATLTLAFAAAQGLFLGTLSGTAFSHLSPGLLVQTVLGTIAAGAGVLFAQALHWIRVSHRFRAFIGAALLGLGLLALADWMLYPVMGLDGLGLRPFGLGLFMALVGVALGASFLPLHLKQVENGVTYGASRDQAWPAAFGLTLTMVWLYVETVRLLTLYQGDDVY